MELVKYTIYSTPVCHFCHQLKDWLKEHNVPFEDVDVASNLEARKAMVEKSHQLGVPVSVIALKTPAGEVGERVLVGFAPNQVADILGL
jgi:glutaredoxin 3